MSTAEWMRELEGLTTSIQTRCRSQQSLLDRTNAAGDVERAKTLLRKYINKNCEEVSAAKIIIKRLNEECASTHSGRLIQTARALGSSLQSAIEESNTLEARLIERVRELESHKASRHAALHKYEADDEMELAAYDNTGGDDEQQVVVVARADSEQLTQALFEAAFQERNADIGLLVEGCREINLLMQDLNEMVIEQGVHLEEIETNTMSTHKSVVGSAQNLRQANRWQDDTGKMWIVVGACIFILILIISAVLASRS